MGELAAILAVAAAAAFALAATLWQRASMDRGVGPGDLTGMLVLVTSWVWLLGLVAQGVGLVLQAAALDRGRVAIVQPLLVTSIVWALPLGYLLTKQAVTRRHVAGAVIIVIGLAAFAVLGDPAAGLDDAEASAWIPPLLVILGLCVVLGTLSRRVDAGGKAAVLGATAGTLFGVAATLMKPVVEAWHTDGLGAVLADWELWVMAVAGLVGFYIQQLSLATGRLVTSVATVSVANPVVSVVLGAVVLQERLDRTPPWRAVTAVCGLTIALLGAVLIASATQRAEPARPVPAPA